MEQQQLYQQFKYQEEKLLYNKILIMKNILFLILLISFSAASQQSFNISGVGGGGAGGSQTPWTSNINADGFTLFGNDGSGENLTLGSTSHATKGKILFGTSAYDGANNRLGIRNATPGYPVDIWDGSIGLVAGADNTASTRTNVTAKNFRFGAAHYTNAEEPTTIMFTANSSGSNQLNFGGGTGTMNAVTDMLFYTTSAVTTLTGTEKMAITNSLITINDPGANFDVRMESDADANMFTLDANALTGSVGGIGIGTALGSVLAKLHITSTIEQFRVGYDASNYYSATVSSTGSPTFNAVGTTPKFIFSDSVSLSATSTDNSATEFLVKSANGTVNTQVLPTISAYASVDSLSANQYTPTLTNNPAGYNSNVASSAHVKSYYIKMGTIVTVWGTITAVATAGSTNSAVAISLPFASNLAANDVTGGAKWNVTVGVNYTDLDGAVNTDATNDRVVIGFNSHAATADHNVYYRFTYQVK